MNKLYLTILTLLVVGCRKDIPSDYDLREGDLLFQALPHAPMVDTIEGATFSVYSHCGLVAKSGGHWIVIEAIGPVRETPLSEWIGRGRERHFAAYRLAPAFSPKIPQIVAEARRFLGRPYDIHYSFDDEKIYCSELIFKAVRNATGCSLGKIDHLGELNWKPYEAFIKSLEGRVPLDREMITPRALSEAKELKQVFSNFPNPQGEANGRPPSRPEAGGSSKAAASGRSL